MPSCTQKAIVGFHCTLERKRAPKYDGIVIPTDAAEDFQLALTRRNGKKWRQRTGLHIQGRMETFYEHRVGGVPARVAIAVAFLKRVGFPIDEMSGENELDLFKSLREFVKGSSKSAKDLMSLNLKRLQDIAGEHGIDVNSSFSKPRLVNFIVAETSDASIFEEEVAESIELREKIKHVIMRYVNNLTWFDWRNPRVTSSTEAPNMALFFSTVEAVVACLKYRRELYMEAEEVADIRKAKMIRYDALVQYLNRRTGSAFRSVLTPGSSLPAHMKNVLEFTVEIENVVPIEEMDDFCQVLNKVKQIGGLSTRYGKAVLHARSVCDPYSNIPGRVGDFCFKYSPSRPLPFFDDLPSEVAVRVANFLVEPECKDLVEAAPSMRAPVYVRLKKKKIAACKEAAAAIWEVGMRSFDAEQSAWYGEGPNRFQEFEEL